MMSPRSQAAQLAPALSTIYQNVQAGYDLTRLPGLGLFYSEQNDERHCPTVLAKFVRRLNALPQLSVIVTVRNVGFGLLRAYVRHTINESICRHVAHICGCAHVCNWDCKRSSLGQDICSHVCSCLVTFPPSNASVHCSDLATWASSFAHAICRCHCPAVNLADYKCNSDAVDRALTVTIIVTLLPLLTDARAVSLL